MEDQSQLTLDRLFESVLQVFRLSHLTKSLFGPVAFADLPRMSRLYQGGFGQSLLSLAWGGGGVKNPKNCLM